ncbi:MAG: hypothetical protein NC350_05045 [Corallococcus sp.]|nr:hypothetical protein [Corallococcus sp.]
MELVYKVGDRPPIGKVIVFALQQLLAILAATIAVPAVINSSMPEGFTPMSQSAALFGAGVGTLVYLLFTKFKSPVFLGSSFAFLGSMATAFAGAATASLGYLGLIIGAVFAGLVYVVIALIVKFAGVNWINKIMPPVVIGPTVAIIGLSLAGNAIGDLMKGSVMKTVIKEVAENVNGTLTIVEKPVAEMLCSPYIALLCGLITLAVTIVCSVYGKKTLKLIPFIIGIAAGYAVAAIFTGIGFAADIDALKVIDFGKFQNIEWYPQNFAFLNAFDGDYGNANIGQYIGTIAVAYIPVAFVVFAEHIADHKNLSSVIGHDLLAEPGLKRTLLGDGVGSIAGALFGGCPNTTYGEAVACVAISGNASVATSFTTALLAIAISFVGPFVTFLATIPNCVMGGVCMALYGFIAVSGLKMLQPVDLGDSRNLFTASVILIAGIGGLKITIGDITITSVACALILGILTNVLCGIGKKKQSEKQKDAPEETATKQAE